MGKIRTRILGNEDIEKKQKDEQKRRSVEKKTEKQKIRAQGLKGGERMKQVEVGEESIAKMENAKRIIAEERGKEIPARKDAEKKKKAKIHKRGKGYQKAKKATDKTKQYNLEEAIKLLKKIKYAKFDESVELHINVHKENIKGEAELPH